MLPLKLTCTSVFLKSGVGHRDSPRCDIVKLIPALCCWIVVSSTTPCDAGQPTLLHQDLDAVMQPRILALLAAGVGGAAVAHFWDDELDGKISEDEPLRTAFDIGNLYGSTTYGLLISGSLWSISRVAGIQQVQPVASEALRALALSNAIVSPLKFGIARKRPDGSNGLSFPSGHSANSFALTTVLTRRYGWRLGIPLYAFTLTVPAARIHDDKHFFSDVGGGAAIGIAAGLSVTRSNEHPTQVELIPTGPGQFLVAARKRF